MPCVRVLITAGPTREPVDPVRFLSNRSTGAMGFALARAALARGHEVRLVLGPVEAPPPPGAEVTRVETAREMLDAVMKHLPWADAVLCAAAVADYRPARPSARKIKRGELRSLDLVENEDVAAAVGKRKGVKRLVVFALETDEGVARSREKLLRKNADLCVLNAPAAIGADRAAFVLLRRDGTALDLGERTKDELAERLFDELA
jgi:phosphopantothenoylcysteine decarboxylase/phosphopantothenate--cysteine ligase